MKRGRARRWGGRSAGAAVLTLGAFLLTAGLAQAATVSAGDQDFGAFLRVRDRDDVRNDLKARIVDGGAVVLVRDRAQPLDVGRGCGPRADWVACRINRVQGPNDRRFGFRLLSITIRAGGGPDRVVLEGRSRYRRAFAFAFVTAGRGEDRFVGGGIAEAVVGGAGADFADLGPGVDQFISSKRHDGADRIEGAGFDVVSYGLRREPVTVDLPGGTSGSAGELDRLQGIHGAFGGTRADVLRGGGARNLILDDRGTDTLRGGGGEDLLDGGLGVDRYFAGSGTDVLFSADDLSETVHCGPHRDFVEPDTIDPLVDCEEFLHSGEFVVIPGLSGRLGRTEQRFGTSVPAYWARHGLRAIPPR